MACHFGPSHSSASGALSPYLDQKSDDCHEAIDVTSGFAPSAETSVPQVGNDLYCPATQHESKVALDNSPIRTNPANGKKTYYCLDRGCNKGFNRCNDLDRHEETHYMTGKAKTFECPELGCNRKGEWGFMRRDKLVDHIRAKHKRSVGQDEFRSTNTSTRWTEMGKWLEANGYESYRHFFGNLEWRISK